MSRHARPDRLILDFGALAAPIGKQLQAQRITVPKRQAALWDDLARSLTFLRLHHVISEAVTRRGEQRIGRAIEQWLRDHWTE